MSRVTLAAMSWHLAQLNIGRLRAPVEDPATGETLCEIASATPEDARAALAAAVGALPRTSTCSIFPL